MRPKEATAATALQEGEPAVCKDVKSGGEPLIVDWKQEQRGNLEIAMKDGVAVVAYSCDAIKLLDSWHCAAVSRLPDGSSSRRW